ncbi:TonB-dependent receptor [Undibacterium sp. KW1]|uniref:TonB-dependent receptor domain-containing protein n=1 Tax=Undibacterium sp. KW1 TaxID=2058624 RepID=UPI001331D11B|nr:TonB-dependent receptor [Undibacterium sp. KW1]BBB60118.1 TonB-dependent receptor [Undibacterium sp. KW1]
MHFKRKLIVVLLANLAIGQAVYAAAQEPVDAQQVVVTATLRNHSIASAPAFTTVVTAEDIAKSPVNSLADLLRETVGVNNQTDGTGRDEIQIRGLGGKYTLMLVNGKRISSGGALWRGSDFDFSSIPLNSIKRVEIVRGPMAALYGSDAIGGVINIITKTPGKEWTGTLNTEYRKVATGDQGDQYRIGASTSGTINDQFSLSVSGEVYDRQPWFSTSASDTTRPARLEKKQSQNLVTTTTWKLSDTQSLDFDFGYNKDKRPRALYYYAYFPEWNFESKDYREQEITRYTYGLSHKASWDWGTSTAFLNQEDTTIDDFNSRYNKPQQRVLKEKNTYVKVYANTELGINSLTAGVDLRHQLIKDPLTYLKTGEISTRSSAIFVEDEISLTKGLHLTLAGRVDDSNTFGNHFSPKTYLSYQVNHAVTVKGGISKAFKAPEAYQLSPEYSVISCGGACYLSGNPSLKPETSTNFEAGVEVHQKGWNMSAVAFKNDVDAMIVANYDSVKNTRNWINIAKAKTSGIELQADVELSPIFSINGNYTHLKADYTDEAGKETKLDNRPANVAKLGVNWKATTRLQTGLTAHYIGRQFYENVELPAYTRLDWNLSARLQDNLILRMGVKNLNNVNLEQKSKDFAYFELGRNYYVSATLAF